MTRLIDTVIVLLALATLAIIICSVMAAHDEQTIEEPASPNNLYQTILTTT